MSFFLNVGVVVECFLQFARQPVCLMFCSVGDCAERRVCEAVKCSKAVHLTFFAKEKEREIRKCQGVCVLGGCHSVSF